MKLLKNADVSLSTNCTGRTLKMKWFFKQYTSISRPHRHSLNCVVFTLRCCAIQSDPNQHQHARCESNLNARIVYTNLLIRCRSNQFECISPSLSLICASRMLDTDTSVFCTNTARFHFALHPNVAFKNKNGKIFPCWHIHQLQITCRIETLIKLPNTLCVSFLRSKIAGFAAHCLRVHADAWAVELLIKVNCERIPMVAFILCGVLTRN